MLIMNHKGPKRYCEEEKAHLKRAYVEGMSSTKKENLPQIRELAKKLKISSEDIKVCS